MGLGFRDLIENGGRRLCTKHRRKCDDQRVFLLQGEP